MLPKLSSKRMCILSPDDHPSLLTCPRRRYEAVSTLRCIVTPSGWWKCPMKTCPGGGVHTAGDRPKVQCTSCTYRGCVVCKTYWHQGFDCEGVPEEKSVDKDWLRSEREKDEEKARLRLLEEDELVTRRMEERERALDNAAPLPAKPCPGAECGIPVSNPRRAPFPTCKSLTLASTTRASPSLCALPPSTSLKHPLITRSNLHHQILLGLLRALRPDRRPRHRVRAQVRLRVQDWEWGGRQQG